MLRPRASTSGGQSAGTDELKVLVSRVREEVSEEESEDGFFFNRARQFAMEVQVRQLREMC